MQKVKRNERTGAIIKMLSERPMHYFSLNDYINKFDAAKSTISEDLALIKNILHLFELGDLETAIGATGGVRYVPAMCEADMNTFAKELSEQVSQTNRILPGGFLYVSDLLCDPYYTKQMGRYFANRFLSDQPDFVITVETKGITIAMMTAYVLNCPLLIARRDNRVTEGPVVTINYLSASDKRIQTMSLARRSLKVGQRGIMIDDFMKGGGTAKGVESLVNEFGAELIGVGVVMATNEMKNKPKTYQSILTLNDVDQDNRVVDVEPTKRI
jgi:purine operon repressor